MQIINIYRPFFIVNIENSWKKCQINGRRRWRAIMRGQMRGLLQRARTSMTMGSAQQTPMSWNTKNKFGVII